MVPIGYFLMTFLPEGIHISWYKFGCGSKMCGSEMMNPNDFDVPVTLRPVSL